MKQMVKNRQRYCITRGPPRSRACEGSDALSLLHGIVNSDITRQISLRLFVSNASRWRMCPHIHTHSLLHEIWYDIAAHCSYLSPKSQIAYIRLMYLLWYLLLGLFTMLLWLLCRWGTLRIFVLRKFLTRPADGAGLQRQEEMPRLAIWVSERLRRAFTEPSICRRFTRLLASKS